MSPFSSPFSSRLPPNGDSRVLQIAEEKFWAAFVVYSTNIAVQLKAGKNYEAFQAVEELLDKHKLPCCFDLTMEESEACLIFSPEGDEELGELLDRLVSSAPKAPGWKFFSRRLRKPIEDVGVIIHTLYIISLGTCRFRRYPARGSLFTMYVPAEADLTEEEAVGLGDTFMWHALGEGFAMQNRIKCRVEFGIPHSKQTLGADELVKSFGL